MPMNPNTTLLSLAASEIDITEYQQYVGSLIHAIVWTRPDIAYAVGMVLRYAATSRQAHMTIKIIESRLSSFLFYFLFLFLFQLIFHFSIFRTLGLGLEVIDHISHI